MLGVYLVNMGSLALTLELATVIQTDRRSLKTTCSSPGDPQMDIDKLLLFLYSLYFHNNTVHSTNTKYRMVLRAGF